MRANLSEDKIDNITEAGMMEIGVIPADKKKVGLERLRFDGEKIVDLADLNTIWVRPLSGGASFELHAIKLPNTQAIEMQYRDRKRLILELDTIRLRTPAEMADLELEEVSARKTRRKNRALRELLDQDFAFKLVFALIIYSRTQNAAIGSLFDELIPIIRDVYDMDGQKEEMKAILEDIKRIVDASVSITSTRG